MNHRFLLLHLGRRSVWTVGLLACCMVLWTAGRAGAETVIELAPVMVVAPNLARPDSVVPGEHLRAAKPVDLAALLAAERPEAALSRRGPLAGDLILRGLSRDNVVITVDETKTYCACPNRMDPPVFHVSSQQIETASFRLGPFSVEHGGALGGTMTVRTAQPEEDPFIRSYGYLGSHEYLAGGFTTGGALAGAKLLGVGGLHFQQGGVYEDGSGTPFTRLPGTNYLPEYADRTAFAVLSGDLKAVRRFADGGSATLSYGYQEASDMLYPGLGMDAQSDVLHRVAVLWRMPVDWEWADEWNATAACSVVDHSMSDTWRSSSRMNPAYLARGFMMRTTAQSSYWGAAVGARKNWSKAHLRYGIEAQRRTWNADNVVGPNSNPMIPNVVSDNGGFWSVFEARQDDWTWEAGGRLDAASSQARDSLDFVRTVRGTAPHWRSDWLPSAYLLVNRALKPGWNLYGGAGYASRLPDPQERYVSLDRPMASPDWIGNPDLDPATSFELQVGSRWFGADWDFSAQGFQSWLGDYIYLTQFNPGGGVRATSYENIEARLHGFSMQAGARLTEGLRLDGGLAWQEGVKKSVGPAATNDHLAEIPPLRARLAARLDWRDWTLRAVVQCQDRLDRIDRDLKEREIDGWTTLDLLAAYQFNEHFTISGGVDNLFDVDYAVANSYLRDPFSSGVVVDEPGRFLFLRLNIDW